MDLFDLGCYFAHHVPVQAVKNPLVKYAACAYAAKQLGRVRGRKAVIGGIATQQADMERNLNLGTLDWAYVGAQYYDKAFPLLRQELSSSGTYEMPVTPLTGLDGISSPPQASVASPQSTSRTPEAKRRRLSKQVTGNSNTDETLGAAAILCVYEFLDNTNTAWESHLSGAKSLFDFAEKEGMLSVDYPISPGPSQQRLQSSKARKAIFWNIARQDLLAACE
jgi:hypothetical protein